MEKRARAFLCLVFAAAVLGSGWLLPRRVHVPSAAAVERGGDIALFEAVVRRVRGGDGYYRAMGHELHARNYPTASPLNWRTPLHLSLLARLGIPAASALLVAIIAASILLLLRASRDPVIILLAVGVPLVGLAAAVTFSEAWAGALIALSLAAYARQRWAAAAVCGVLAVFMRELAVFYALGCGLIALHSRRTPELGIWIGGAAAYLAYYAWHVHGVRAFMPADALMHAHSWVQWGGFRFVHRTAEWYGWAKLAPAVLGPVVVAAGLLGAAAQGMSIQARVALVAYAVAFAIVGMPFNSYWGLVTVPLWGLGIVNAFDATRRIVRGGELHGAVIENALP